MGTPYKMKGSPMQRNFGISPVKQDVDLTRKLTPPMEGALTDAEKEAKKKKQLKISNEQDNKELDAKERAEGATTNIKTPKVFKDGTTNELNQKKIKTEQDRFNALTPAQKQAEIDAANIKANKFHGNTSR